MSRTWLAVGLLELEVAGTAVRQDMREAVLCGKRKSEFNKTKEKNGGNRKRLVTPKSDKSTLINTRINPTITRLLSRLLGVRRILRHCRLWRQTPEFKQFLLWVWTRQPNNHAAKDKGEASKKITANPEMPTKRSKDVRRAKKWVTNSNVGSRRTITSTTVISFHLINGVNGNESKECRAAGKQAGGPRLLIGFLPVCVKYCEIGLKLNNGMRSCPRRRYTFPNVSHKTKPGDLLRGVVLQSTGWWRVLVCN